MQSPTLTRPTGWTFLHINARYSYLEGRIVSGTRDPITGPESYSNNGLFCQLTVM